MKHIKIEYTDDETTVVHLEAPVGDSYALCGDDTAGDESLGWRAGYETIDPITCSVCIKIINYCKRVKQSQLTHSPKDKR